MNQQLIDDLKETKRLLKTHGRCTGALQDGKELLGLSDGEKDRLFYMGGNRRALGTLRRWIEEAEAREPATSG